MSGPRVLTVILNWRTPAMTLEAAAAALRGMDGIAGEIVIVDNASGDASLEAMSAAVAAAGWSRVRVIAAGRNGGYGAGNNTGIRAGLAGGGVADYVYILNSDAFPGAVAALLAYLEAHPAVGFAGSAIHGPDGTPHGTTFRFPSIAGELESGARSGPVTRWLARWRVAVDPPAATGPVDWLAGASVMMRAAALRDAGLFDEGYFLYFDETDLCLRAARAGWPTSFVRESAVTHLGSVSTGMRDWRRVPGYWFDSRLRYFVRNHGVAYAATATAALAAGCLVWRARCLLARRPVGTERFLRDLLAHDLRACLPGTRERAALAAATVPLSPPAPPRAERSPA